MKTVDQEPDSNPPEGGLPRHDAVHEAREIVEFTTHKVKSARDFVVSIHSPYLGTLLVLYVIAAIWGIWTVFFGAFRDWYMYASMFLVSLIFLLLYIKAHYQRRPVVKAFTLLSNIVLHSYWMWVLYDRIPERRVWYNDKLVLRPEVSGLWGPIIIVGLITVGLLAHYAVIGRVWDRADIRPPSQ